MPVADHIKTYTITDLKVAPYSETGEYDPLDLLDVPGIQSCQITVANDAVELRGDNTVIAVVDQGNSGEWEMSEGGISIPAAKVMFGGTVTDTGTGDDEVRTWRLKDNDQRPYFTFVGVSPDDGAGGDLHMVVYKAKATGNLELTMADQEFMAPSFSGRALGRDLDRALFDLIQHETAAAAATSLPEAE